MFASLIFLRIFCISSFIVLALAFPSLEFIAAILTRNVSISPASGVVVPKPVVSGFLDFVASVS